MGPTSQYIVVGDLLTGFAINLELQQLEDIIN